MGLPLPLPLPLPHTHVHTHTHTFTYVVIQTSRYIWFLPFIQSIVFLFFFFLFSFFLVRFSLGTHAHALTIDYIINQSLQFVKQRSPSFVLCLIRLFTVF